MMSEESKNNCLKKSIEMSKEELLKLSKIGMFKLELARLNNKKNMKFKKIGKKAFTLLEENTLSTEFFEPDYSELLSILNSIEETKKSIDNLRKQQKIEVIDHKSDNHEKTNSGILIRPTTMNNNEVNRENSEIK
jgi:hypothetical protein